MDAFSYVYSDSLDEMVVRFFWHGKQHYTWNDDDCLYYSDDSDEDYFHEVPPDAIIG